MPYKKRTQRTKRRRPQKKRGPTTKQLATRIKKLEHTEELKYIDYLDTAALAVAGTNKCYSLLGQGDDFNQRIGEETRVKYLNCHLRFTKAASANSSQIRIILYWDMATDGLGPTLLASSFIGAGLLDDTFITTKIMSPHNYRTSDRYKILYDKTIYLNPDSSSVVINRMIKINRKLGGAKIKYADSGSTVTSIVSRALNMCFFADSSAVTDVTVYNSTRVWFTDS